MAFSLQRIQKATNECGAKFKMAISNVISDQIFNICWSVIVLDSLLSVIRWRFLYPHQRPVRSFFPTNGFSNECKKQRMNAELNFKRLFPMLSQIKFSTFAGQSSFWIRCFLSFVGDSYTRISAPFGVFSQRMGSPTNAKSNE
jgi:hypothetical protein